MEEAGKIVLSMQDAAFAYKGSAEVLKDINLELRAGDFVFLTGPSGAGKTTLLSLIQLGLRPTRGRIELFGRGVDYRNRDSTARLRRRIGVVFQDYKLLSHLCVLDNVALPLRIAGKSAKYINSHVPELLEWVGLKEFIRARPEELSGGQQQRVAIARAVVGRPDILIADEPTGNVDEDMAKKLLYLFGELNRMGTTIIIATHSSNLIGQTQLPVIHLEHGLLRGVRGTEDV